MCAQCSATLDPSAQFCGICGTPLVGSQAPTLVGTASEAGPTDPMIGREVIGQYVVRHKIGAGGMGAVYLADQPSMGRRAVIKVLHPWLSKDPEVAARFDNEARAVARLSDPHIVQIFNYGAMADGTLFLAMEHIDGRTLTQVLAAHGSLPVERAVDIAVQICGALAESHRQEVVHRDLKPANIMLIDKPGGELVKVLDFGVAKLHGSSQTSTGQTVGTPRYMSPEQLSGDVVDGRSDLYAVGLVLYEMLAGEPPFVADTPVGYVHKHMSVAPPPLAIAAPTAKVPAALSAAIMRALAKEPQARHPNAASFADALRAALRSASAAPTHVALPTAEPAASAASAASAAVDDDSPSRLGVVLGALLGLAAIGGGVYWGITAWSGGEQETASAQSSSAAQAAATQGGSGDQASATGTTGETGATAATGTTGETGATGATGTSGTTQGMLATGATGAMGATGATGTPLPPLSADAAKLLESSVVDLETEFFALLERSNIPPSAKVQVRDGYGTMARALAPGPLAETQRKTYLVQVILGYRNTPQLPPGFDLPIARLESILKHIKGPITVAQRMETYTEMVKGFNESYRSPDDAEYYRRYALVSLIETFSGDKEYLARQLD